jgi:hypothetical protein
MAPQLYLPNSLQDRSTVSPEVISGVAVSVAA